MFGMVPFDYNNHNWFDAFDNFEKNFFGNSNVDLPDFRTDIRDADGKYVLEAELPGFNKEDIQLDVKDGILTITAQHTENEDEKNDKGEYIRRERRYGSCPPAALMSPASTKTPSPLRIRTVFWS